MALNRTALIRGPANITWNSFTYYTQGDITVKLSKETFDIITSAHGLVDQRVTERVTEVSFTPAGEWEDGPFQALFPGAATIPGASWYGSSDLPLVIQPINASQNKITFTNANINKPPQLILSAVKTLMGPVTFRCLNKNNVAWSDAASLLTVAAGTPSDAAFSDTAIKTQPYLAAWGSVAGFTAVHTIDGWTIDFNLQLEPFNTDAYGVLDMTFVRCDVTAKCMPIGPTEAQATAALAIQDTGAIRGASLNAGGANLVISAIAADATTATFLTLNQTNLISADINYGMNSNRHGEFEWRTSRKFTTGAVQPVFAFTTPS